MHHAFLWQNGRMPDLGTLGGTSGSDAVAINAGGQIIGNSFAALSSDGTEVAARAFLWQNGKMIDLGTLGGKSSTAVAINDRGQIIGAVLAKDSRGSDVSRAFLWQNGRITYLAMPRGHTTSHALAINERGQIVGWAGRPAGSDAFVWANGKATDLGMLVGSGIEADAHAYAINERGEIVGESQPNHDSPHAVLWTQRN